MYIDYQLRLHTQNHYMQILNRRGSIIGIAFVFLAIIILAIIGGITPAIWILLISITIITIGSFWPPVPSNWPKWMVVAATLVFSITAFMIDDPSEQIILFICLIAPMMGYAARFIVVDGAKRPAVAIIILIFSNLALWVLEFEFPAGVPKLVSNVPMDILKLQTIVAFIGGLIILLEVISFIAALQEENVHNKESLSWLNLIMNLISHNLRTPLTNASMSQQMLKMSAEKDSVQERQIDTIGSSIEVMDDTINRLIRAGSITDMVSHRSNKELIDEFQRAYPEITIKVLKDYDVSGQLNIALQLAIEVFVDNAIKHGGEEVELCFCAQQIKISDNGNGLNNDQMKQFGARLGGQHSNANLHGIGINFALRVLEAVGWSATPTNTDEGFEVVMRATSSGKNSLASYISK